MHTKGQEMLTRIVRGRWQERAVRKKDSMMIIKDSEKDSEILKETQHNREKKQGKEGVPVCQSQTMTLACVTAPASRASYRR